jgi:polyphenol oxidase
MKSAASSIGEIVQFGQTLIFFGDRNSELANIKQEFPNLQFQRLRQTHGLEIFSTTLETVNEIPEGDAHWTRESNLGLCISTADCIPLFVVDSKTSTIGAIHAGWRGVRDQIAKALILEIQNKCGTRIEDLSVFIGPHIQLSSFEVEDPIRESLLGTIKDSQNCFLTSGAGKSLVDLNLVIHRQLSELGIAPDRIIGEKVDTKTESRYHSFRRDSIRAGRQLSFIAKLK